MSEGEYNGPKLVTNHEEGGKGYWNKVSYTDGGGNVKTKEEWVQITARTKGPLKGVDPRPKKPEFVPPRFVDKLSQSLDDKQEKAQELYESWQKKK